MDDANQQREAVRGSGQEIDPYKDIEGRIHTGLLDDAGQSREAVRGSGQADRRLKMAKKQSRKTVEEAGQDLYDSWIQFQDVLVREMRDFYTRLRKYV